MESGFNGRCHSDEPLSGKEEFSVALCGLCGENAPFPPKKPRRSTKVNFSFYVDFANPGSTYS